MLQQKFNIDKAAKLEFEFGSKDAVHSPESFSRTTYALILTSHEVMTCPGRLSLILLRQWSIVQISIVELMLLL